MIKPFATLFITSAVTGAPFKRKASTMEITLGISSSGSNDGRPRFFDLILEGLFPLLVLATYKKRQETFC